MTSHKNVTYIVVLKSIVVARIYLDLEKYLDITNGTCYMYMLHRKNYINQY